MDSSALLEVVNEQHGTRFALVGRFAGGEGSGATEIVDADGCRWVLKASDGDQSFTALSRDLLTACAARVAMPGGQAGM